MSHQRVITVFSSKNDTVCEVEYPTLEKYLNEGYLIKQTLYGTSENAAIVNLTFILEKPE